MKCVCVCVCVYWLYAVLYDIRIGVYQCAVCGVLYRSVCVGIGGMCSPDCGRAVCSGGLWWRFKVLGVVCVCDQVSA